MSFGSSPFEKFSSGYGLGHNGVMVSLNYFEGLPVLQNISSTELQLCFKSLTKRDVKTKEKALSDLIGFIQDDDKVFLFQDDILIASWSQVYAKLISSTSKTIRVGAHRFTCLLIKKIGKPVSKFLREFIPLLLSGLYDIDSSVSQSCHDSLVMSFNDGKKVESLWKLFSADILNFVKQVVLFENANTISDERYSTKDDSSLRYRQLSIACVGSLTRLLGILELHSDEAETLHEIISVDNLWSRITVKDTKNLRLYQSLLKLTIRLHKNNLFRKNKEALKFSSQHILRSLAEFSSSNLISLSSVIPDLLLTLLELNKYKDGKFWTYHKMGKHNFHHLMSLGPGIADSIYYSLAYSLFKETSILDSQTEWLPIWYNYITVENDRRIMGRNGSKLIVEAWRYYFEVLSSLESYDLLIVQNQILCLVSKKKFEGFTDIIEAITSSNLKLDFLLDKLIASTVSVSEKNKVEVLMTYNILEILLKKNLPLDHLTDAILNRLEKNRDTVTFSPDYEFTIFDYLIKSNCTWADAAISKFLFELSSFVKEDFYELPAKIMIDFSNSIFIESSDWQDYFNDFILCMIQSPSSRLYLINFLDKVNVKLVPKIIENSEPFKEFIDVFIENYTFEDDAIFKSRILTGSILVDLYDAAKDKGKLKEFSELLETLPSTNEALQTLLLSTDFLPNTLARCEEIRIPPAAQKSEVIADKVVAVLLDGFKSDHLSSEEKIEKIISQLNENSLVTRKLLKFHPQSVLSSHIKGIDSRVSISSPLGLLSHVISEGESFDLNLCLKLIRFSQFIDQLLITHPKLISDEIRLFLTWAYEVTVDYNSFATFPVFYSHKNTLYPSTSRFEFTELLSGLSESSDNKIINALLNTSVSKAVAFYNCRIFYRLLLNSLDYISVSKFDQLLDDIEKRTRNLLSSKERDTIKLFQLGSFLAACSIFNKDSEKLNNLRNLFFAELIGIRPSNESEIQRSFIPLVFSIMLLTFDSYVDTEIPIQQRRLTMGLNSIELWMQGDLWYDPLFDSIRLAIIQLFEKLLNFSPSIESSEKLHDLTVTLLNDSLGFLEIEETTYYDELRFYSFKLLNVAESHISVSSEIDLDSYINAAFTNLPSNSPVLVSYCKPLLLFLKNIPLRQKCQHLKRFITEFVNPDIPLELMNVLSLQLKVIIKEMQQDLVVEYELKKASLTSNTDIESTPDIDLDVKLPKELFDALNTKLPEEYFEFHEKSSFMRYLNYCHLLTFYFNDISYDLRQRYIDQLKETNLINRLLDFLTDQMVLTDLKYWDKFEVSDVLLHPNSVDRGTMEPVDECNIMMEYLLYQFFTIFGSLVCTWWNNIKNRELKESISKFVTSYISPALIDAELKKTYEGLNKINKDDLNLTVKMNRNSNEIKASYLIDEQKLEVAFKLPSNYPLQNIQVQGLSRVGITEQQWKSWILSTQRIISSMNGSVLDSLELLSKNVKLQFSGFEECAICYYILHAIDRKLPSKVCPTCKNRFHGACLYKWFKSSGNNTCPLCRSEFNLRK